MTTIYKAHINESTGQIQTVREHSEGTARLCEEFAVQPLKSVAAAMGMLHDTRAAMKIYQKDFVMIKSPDELARAAGDLIQKQIMQFYT